MNANGIRWRTSGSRDPADPKSWGISSSVQDGLRAALDVVPLALEGVNDLAPDICHNPGLWDHLPSMGLHAPCLPDVPTHNAMLLGDELNLCPCATRYVIDSIMGFLLETRCLPGCVVSEAKAPHVTNPKSGSTWSMILNAPRQINYASRHSQRQCFCEKQIEAMVEQEWHGSMNKTKHFIHGAII